MRKSRNAVIQDSYVFITGIDIKPIHDVGRFVEKPSFERCDIYFTGHKFV